MNADRFTGSADVGEVLVDKQRTVAVVEGALAADETFDVFDPTRVVDQFLKRFAGLLDLLQIQTLGRARKEMSMDVAVPLPRFGAA